MKKSFGWIGYWLCLLLVLPFQHVGAAEVPFGKGILFRVEQAGSPPSYLFGTIHSEDPRVVRLAPPVHKALAEAERVVLELELDGASIMAAANGMVFPDGRELPQVLGPELYQQVVTAAADRIPEVLLKRYKVWVVATELSMPPVKTGEFLDLLLARYARLNGKQVVGLETVDEQLSLFDDMPEADQVQMLKDVLNYLPEMPMMFEELLQAYLERDLGGLMAVNEKYAEAGDSELEQTFQKRLIDDRNRRMVERLLPMLRQGRLFVGVGALHLPGEKGVLRLLQQQGYQVEAVY